MKKIMLLYYVVTFVGSLSYFNASFHCTEVSSNGAFFESRKAEDVGGVITLHRVQTWKKYYHPVWSQTH